MVYTDRLFPIGACQDSAERNNKPFVARELVNNQYNDNDAVRAET